MRRKITCKYATRKSEFHYKANNIKHAAIKRALSHAMKRSNSAMRRAKNNAMKPSTRKTMSQKLLTATLGQQRPHETWKPLNKCNIARLIRQPVLLKESAHSLKDVGAYSISTKTEKFPRPVLGA